MKRLRSFFLILVLLGALSLPVMAADSATSLQSTVTVDTRGTAYVTLTVQLHLDAGVSDITFPLPKAAKAVQLNGSHAGTRVEGDHRLLSLPIQVAGDHTVTISYQLEDAVSRDTENAATNLPLLSGFAYPIDSMHITVSLPGDILGTPVYTSGYHQTDITQAISTQISGNTLTATVDQPLKDHETLVVSLQGSARDYPDVSLIDPLMDGWDGAVLVCICLAALYYLITLFPRFYRKTRCCNPPEGISAGEVGTCLTGTGADLTLMVITWARLGYLRIHRQGKQKILLHKQMEMGNERSYFENRVFAKLFQRRDTVDGTGLHYAVLCRQVSKKSPLMKELFRPKSGKTWIFRVLACAAGALSGVKLGMAMAEQTVWQVVLAIALCVLCGMFSYWIQSGGKCLPLRNKMPLCVALGCSALWIGLGVLAGRVTAAVLLVGFQLLAGVAIAYGGRRSELGKRSAAAILGLRHYMVRGNTFDLQKRMEENPFFFYELAPYALALGVEKRFAKRLGKAKLPDCSFLQTDDQAPATAYQWALQLNRTVKLLNGRKKRLVYERLIGK